jgi:hypothetical protein
MTLHHALSASGRTVVYDNGRLRHIDVEELLIIIDYKSVAKIRKILQCDGGKAYFKFNYV